jgi:hypothetical protein
MVQSREEVPNKLELRPIYLHTHVTQRPGDERAVVPARINYVVESQSK